MQMTPSIPRLITLCAAAAIAAGCSMTSSSSTLQTPLASGLGAHPNSLSAATLVAINISTGVLEGWPMTARGGPDPEPLSMPLGAGAAGGMVANGHVVAIASEFPPDVVVYNISTKTKTTLPDPYGTPIDIAIDKNSVLYVINIASGPSNVVMYPPGSSQPTKLDCSYLNFGQAIAVDNEGDIFINGYGFGNFVGVVEIPNGPGGPQPQNCMRLHLQSEPGYVAGLAVDPKTDALIVLDDPDLCAGGIEGRMTIYPKPYQKSTAITRYLNANCAGTVRLNADSSVVFVGDQDVSGSFTFILQRSFPGGRTLGTYVGGQPGAFTTIPNTLPN